MVNILVTDRVDIATGPLHKEGDTVEIFLNGLGGKSGNIGTIARFRGVLNRMTGKVVDHRHWFSIQSVEPQYSNIRIHRSNRGNLIIRRQGIGAAHIHFPTIPEVEPSVFHDARFLPYPCTNLYRDQPLYRLPDYLNRTCLGFGMNSSMAMTGIK